MATVEEKKAWREYLRDTRHLRGSDYEKAEPHAWTRLSHRLEQSIGKKPRKVKIDAAEK